MSVVDKYIEGVTYFTIIQNKTETPNNRFEWGEGIRRFLHPTEEQFGRGRRSGPPPLKFLLIRSVQFASDTLDLIENGRVVHIIWRDLSEGKTENGIVHVLSSSLMREIEGADTGGSILTRAAFFPPVLLPS